MALERVLARELARSGVVRRGRFVLSSGRISNIYIDLRVLPSMPQLFRLALSMLYARAYHVIEESDAIVGVATGGIAWSTGLALLSGKPSGYVRPERKEHGASRRVEMRLQPGARILVVDDVATTGGSLAGAVEALRGEGFRVSHALVVVDRGEGAGERLAGMGVRLMSLLSLGDILGALEELGD